MKKIHDNTIKDNVPVTSLNLSRNNGTIRILTHFLGQKPMVKITDSRQKFDTVVLFLSLYT